MLLLPAGLMATAVPAGPPLDGLAVAVRGAYGARRLRTGHAGPCMRVRRTDDAEADIGFDASGGLDTAALLAHCGAGSGWVARWHDQSGLGQDVIQAVAARQPRIVASGVVSRLANPAARPAPAFTKAQACCIGLAGFALGGPAFAAMAVGSRTTDAGQYGRMVSYTGTGQAADSNNTASAIPVMLAAGPLCGWVLNALSSRTVGTAPLQASSVFDGVNHVLRVGGAAGSTVAQPAGLAATGTLSLGANTLGTTALELWDGLIAEVILTSGALSTPDRTGIEASQRAYWGVP